MKGTGGRFIPVERRLTPAANKYFTDTSSLQSKSATLHIMRILNEYPFSTYNLKHLVANKTINII